MAKRKPKSKKKGKRRESRDQKLTSCEGCGVELLQEEEDYDGSCEKKEDMVESPLYCVCTRVRFCSRTCLLKHPHKDCPGPPKRRLNLNDTLNCLVEAKEHQEYNETVAKPCAEYLLAKGLTESKVNKLTAWDYAEFAREGDKLGNQACAYLAGVRFRSRILSATKESLSVRNSKSHNTLPVLKSQELAFENFKKASKLGHGLAMLSLGMCFDEGIGCRKDRRRCNHWLWRSHLHHSHHSHLAISELDSRSMIGAEILRIGEAVKECMGKFPPGRAMCFSGPNLASLYLAMHHVVERENFSLPPFACTRATRMVIIGSNAMKETLKITKKAEQRGNPIVYRYGRRGVVEVVLGQPDCSRQVENQLFVVPPAANCDERVTEEERRHWSETQMGNLYLADAPVIVCGCVHGKRNDGQDRLVCKECEMDAMDRLDAVSCGSVVLSKEEELLEGGQTAIYRSKSRGGSLKIETWKNYCGGEAECALALLVASGMSPYCAPLFIAQDPNFYWPLIANHGSIRAALEFVAPHIDWNQKLGPAKEKLSEQEPLVKNTRPGKCLRKCGNPLCTNLEKYSANRFSTCRGCKRRSYCCKDCQRADWPFHKQECKLVAQIL